MYLRNLETLEGWRDEVPQKVWSKKKKNENDIMKEEFDDIVASLLRFIRNYNSNVANWNPNEVRI